MPSGEQRRRGGFGLILLFYQVFGNIGIDRIPPATLIITALQVLLYMRVIRVPWHGLDDVCISVDKVWEKKQYRRLLIGAFEHADDYHLYYNMISFIWKGITLERLFGSGRFFFMVSVFTCLCNLTLVALSKLAGEFYDHHFFYQCAVGFSGVIFALKVLTTHYWPQNEGTIMGLPITLPAKYIVWAELILIQLLVPNVSFLGHLAGVLVGVVYVYTPLKSVMSRIWRTMASVLFATPQPYRLYPSNNYFNNYPDYDRFGTNNWRRRLSPYGNEYQWGNDQDLPYPPNPDSPYRNPPTDRQSYSASALEEDAMLQRAIEESLRESNFEYNERYENAEWNEAAPSAPFPEVPVPSVPSSHLPYPETPPTYPSVPSPSNANRLYPDLDIDEVRRRRLNRFQ